MKLRSPGKDKNLKNYEIQIISFLIRKDIFIKLLFSNRSLDQILNFFYNEDTRKVAEYILKYYQKYNEVLSDKEFENLLDNSLSSEEITEGQYADYGKVYDKSKEFISKLDNSQFNRILEEWLEAEISVHIKLFIDQNGSLLNKNKGGEFVENALKEFRLIKSSLESDEKYVHILDISRDTDQIKEEIKNRIENPDEYKGIPTYYPSLDRHFGGFETKTLTLLGGLSGSGKSTLSLNFAHNIYKKGKKKVLYISLEMPREQCTRKLNSRESHILYNKLKNPEKLSDEELEKLYKVIDDRANDEGVFKILDIPANRCTWDEILTAIRDEMPEYNPDIIFIDHLGLIALPSTGERRDVLLGNLTKEIRSYAKIQDIAIVGLVQANRASKTRNKKTNKYEINIELENIEDSNKMGQDCDNFLAVIMEKKDEIAISMFVDIKKQRDGEKDIRLPFETDLSCCLIFDKESLLEEDEESWLSYEKEALEEFENQEDILIKEIEELEEKVGEDFKTEDFKTEDNIEDNNIDEKNNKTLVKYYNSEDNEVTDDEDEDFIIERKSQNIEDLIDINFGSDNSKNNNNDKNNDIEKIINFYENNPQEIENNIIDYGETNDFDSYLFGEDEYGDF